MVTLFETSFECGNKVGGIWTVITSKVPFIKQHVKDYYAIGFFNPEAKEIIEKPAPSFLKKIFFRLRKKGIKCTYGSWIHAEDSKIILVDSRGFYEHTDNIKGIFWEKFKVDSLQSGFDYDEPLSWIYAVGMLLFEMSKVIPGKKIAQFHEWLSGSALLYLKETDADIKKVFTTHATVLGRATGGNFGCDIKNKAKEMGVTAKHTLEKAAAQNADVFTTVSDTTGKEAAKVLGRKPDFITYNAMGSLEDLSGLEKEKSDYRKKIDEFVRAYFSPYYSLDLHNYPVLYTAGRYEFTNKGYDTFIASLGLMNRSLKASQYEGWVLAFILVPKGTLGVKQEVSENFSLYKSLKNHSGQDKVFQTRQGKNPQLCALELSGGEENDAIVQALRNAGLNNSPEDKVKVVYLPAYINRKNDLLDMNFREFLISSSMGVFLSRYEPWGYTPMEAASYLSTTITTHTAGFGSAVSKLGVSKGIYVVKKQSPESVSKIMETFVKLGKKKRVELESDAHRVVRENFTWEKLGKRYLLAYSLMK